MNRWMAAAAGLMALTLVAHVFGGGPEVIDVVMASPLPDVVRMLSAVVWHGITVMLAVSVVGLGYLARHENRGLAMMIAGVQIGFVGLFLGYGIFGLGNISEMPQWSVFLAMPIMMALGSRGRAT
ncbi:MAG: hypothetical protein Q9M48_09165 [Rhodobacterales bacterium]|nr:hypothetical protein [Rhodobacterales bacterium]